MWRRVAPSARRRPISERRSSTEMTMTLAIPTPPTSSATAPRPRNSEVNAPSAAARASSASDGRETDTSSGFSGFAVPASASRTLSIPSVLDAHVDFGGSSVGVVPGLGLGQTDQRGAVDPRVERDGAEDADDAVIAVADPDLGTVTHVGDSEPLRGDRAENHGRERLRGVCKEASPPPSRR